MHLQRLELSFSFGTRISVGKVAGRHCPLRKAVISPKRSTRWRTPGLKSVQTVPTPQGPVSKVAMTTISQHDCVLPSGLRARIFYPCERQSNAPRAQWMPASHPDARINENAVALAEYLQLPVPKLAARALGFLLRGYLPWTADAATTRAKLPLVLFSHGLGGSLAGYVSACADLARTGRVVVAVEHAEGSAFATFVGAERRRVAYKFAPDNGVEDARWREIQLKQRVSEFVNALNDIRGLSKGSAPAQLPLVPGGTVVDLRDCIDEAQSIAVAGHSFGAGTALGFTFEAQSGEIDVNVSHAICLDPWFVPLGTEVVANGDVGDTKVLFVDQELSGMTQSVVLRKNFRKPSGNGGYWSAVVVGGGHNNASDFATRLPKLIAETAGLSSGRANRDDMMEAQNRTLREFLGTQWSEFWEKINANSVEGLKRGVLPGE